MGDGGKWALELNADDNGPLHLDELVPHEMQQLERLVLHTALGVYILVHYGPQWFHVGHCYRMGVALLDSPL